MDGEPFRAHEAKRRIRVILTSGFVDFDLPHFKREAAKDRIDMLDVTNVLRAGTVSEAEMDVAALIVANIIEDAPLGAES